MPCSHPPLTRLEDAAMGAWGEHAWRGVVSTLPQATAEISRSVCNDGDTTTHKKRPTRSCSTPILYAICIYGMSCCLRARSRDVLC